MDDINNIDWIDEMHNEEKKYKKFYKKNVTKIYLCFFYPDSKTQKRIYTLNTPSYITRNEISELMCDKQKYYIHEIFKYNADIDNDDINDYIESPMLTNNEYRKIINNYNTNSIPEFFFITKEKKEEDIFFNDTIAMFEKVNTLFIFLKDTNMDTNNKSNKRKHINPKTKTRKIKHLQNN